MLKKGKEKTDKEIKVDYNLVCIDLEDTQRRLDVAFNILFESVLKEHNLDKKNGGK